MFSNSLKLFKKSVKFFPTLLAELRHLNRRDITFKLCFIIGAALHANLPKPSRMFPPINYQLIVRKYVLDNTPHPPSSFLVKVSANFHKIFPAPPPLVYATHCHGLTAKVLFLHFPAGNTI